MGLSWCCIVHFTLNNGDKKYVHFDYFSVMLTFSQFYLELLYDAWVDQRHRQYHNFHIREHSAIKVLIGSY